MALKKSPFLIGALALLLFSVPGILASQPSSYQSTMDENPQGLYLWKAVANESDEIALLSGHFEAADSQYYFDVLPLKNPDGVNNGFKVKRITADSFNFSYHIYDAALIGDEFIYAYNYIKSPVGGGGASVNGLVLNAVNLVTGEGWGKHFDARRAGGQIVAKPDGSFLYFRTVTDSTIAFTSFDANGNFLGHSGYKFQRPNVPDYYTYFIVMTQAEIASDGNIYLMGFFRKLQSADIPFMAKISPDGSSSSLRILDGITYNKFILSENGPILLNYSSDYLFNFRLKVAGENAKIVQLDNNLDFLWAKEYSGEHYRYTAADIGFSTSGNILLSHSTDGVFPVVLTELDNNGNILSQKGYPSYYPQLDVLNDGSLLIASAYNFDADGNILDQPVIAKTDPNGEIEGCTTLPTCLTAKDISIGLSPLSIVPFGNDSFEDFPIEISPTSISFSQGCNYPPAPIPDFMFPDTLCFGDVGCATGTTNRLANAHEWRLTGPGLTVVNTDSFEFCYRFLNPGNYTLQQTIWVLGCSTVFEKTITVIPKLEVAISPEILCPGEPYELIASSNRPLEHYEWSTGDTLSVLPITNSGSYGLLATDGICNAVDQLDVQLLEDRIGQESPIKLSNDTTICDANLPFELHIESSFADSFTYKDETILNGTLQLEQAGQYQIAMEIEGCLFTKIYTIDTIQCKAKIYFPNAFSPNGDGVNDSFFAQGVFYETISLEIFDRWGGKVFEGKGEKTKWHPEHNFNQGTYFYLFTFQNLLSGKTENIYGEVTLLR